MKKIISMVLAVLLIVTCMFALASCKDKLVIPSEIQREKTKYLLVAEGVSEYFILLADDAAVKEADAAEELQSVLKSATGATLPIVYESNAKLNNKTSVISIGDTNFAESRGVKTDGNLGRSGYVIKNIDNQLFIKADGDKRGCLYAVYDFLYDAVGYRYYYIDEIQYNTMANVPLYAYDDTEIPTFDFRSTWYQILTENEDYRTHLRYSLFDEEYGWKAHTQTDRVVKFDNFKNHAYGAVKTDPETGETLLDENGQPIPDHWFSNNANTQLCWTAGYDLELQAATDLYINITGSSAEKIYFSLGQADGSNFCTCPRCEQAKKDWGMNDAGLQINFANNVVDIIQEWVARDYPEGKDVRIVLFAYKATETPPMVSDGNGGWVPYSDKVIPHEKLYFEMAPINSDYSVPLEDVANAEVYSNLTKWHALLKDNERMSIWTYETNYSYFLYPFNNFDTFQVQMKTYSQNGITNMFSQGPAYTNQPGFQEMRLWVQSQIMWDVDRSYSDLAYEFIDAYYKDASAEIREYYDLIRALYEKATLKGNSFASIYADISTKDVWTEGVVDGFSKLFQRAYAKIEHYKTEDAQMWQKLYDRLKALEVTITYTKLNYYRSNYTQAELNVLIDELNYYCSKNGYNYIAEMGANPVGLFDAYKQ